MPSMGEQPEADSIEYYKVRADFVIEHSFACASVVYSAEVNSISS